MDLRRIALWKREGIKDGRALLRWVHTFVDRTTIEGQMKLTNDINGMSNQVTDTLLGLSEHLFNLWEMWLALSSSDRNLPNSFFSILLISMPTVPECPIVHVRPYLVDILDRGESQLLTNIDGDSGMFAKMLKYAEHLGMQDASSDWEQPHGNKLSAAGRLNYQAALKAAIFLRGGSDQGAKRVLLLVCVLANDAWQRRVHLQAHIQVRPSGHHEQGEARVRQAPACVREGEPREESQGRHQAREGVCRRLKAGRQAGHRLHGFRRVGAGQQRQQRRRA